VGGVTIAIDIGEDIDALVIADTWLTVGGPPARDIGDGTGEGGGRAEGPDGDPSPTGPEGPGAVGIGGPGDHGPARDPRSLYPSVMRDCEEITEDLSEESTWL